MNDGKPTPATPWNLRQVTKLIQEHGGTGSRTPAQDLVGTLVACALAKRHALVLTPTTVTSATAATAAESTDIDATVNAIHDIATQLFQVPAIRIDLPLSLSPAGAPGSTPGAAAPSPGDHPTGTSHTTATTTLKNGPFFPSSNASLAAMGRSTSLSASASSIHDHTTPLLHQRLPHPNTHQDKHEPFPSLSSALPQQQQHTAAAVSPTSLNRLFQSQLVIHPFALAAAAAAAPPLQSLADPPAAQTRSGRHATMDSISSTSHGAFASSASNTLLRRRLISLPGAAGNNSRPNSAAGPQHVSHRRSLVDPLTATPPTGATPSPPMTSKQHIGSTSTMLTASSAGKRVANVVVVVLNQGHALDPHVQDAMLEVMHTGHVNDGKHLVPLPSLSAAKTGGLFMWVVVVPYQVNDSVPKVGMCAQLMTHFLLSTVLPHAPPASPVFATPLPKHLHLTPPVLASLLQHAPPSAPHLDICRYMHDVLVSLRTYFSSTPVAANLVREWTLALNVMCHPSVYGSGVVTADVVQWVVTKVVAHRILLGTAGREARFKKHSVDEVLAHVARAIDRVPVPV